MKITPNGNWIIFTKCIRGDGETSADSSLGGILLPHMVAEKTNFAVVNSVGPKCKVFDNKCIGKYIQCPELSNDMYRISGETFAIKESALTLLAVFEE